MQYRIVEGENLVINLAIPGARAGEKYKAEVKMYYPDGRVIAAPLNIKIISRSEVEEQS